MTAAEYNENFGTQVQLERSQLLYKMNEGSLGEEMLTLADKRYAVVGKAKELVLRGADAADLSEVVYLVVSDQNEFGADYDLSAAKRRGSWGSHDLQPGV